MTTDAPPGGLFDPFCGSGGLSAAVQRPGRISEVYAAGDIENARIPHPDWETILGKLKHSKQWSKNTADPYCLMITGGTGVGKSALVDHYMLMNPPYETPAGRTVPVLKVTTPSVPTMKALVERAIISLLGRLPQKGSSEEQTERLLRYLKIAGVEQVIFDEFQHVIEHGRGKFAQEASDWLKNLISLSHLSVALVGMPSTAEILDNAQLRRRFMSHCRLPRYVWSDGSLEKFGTFLDRLEQALPFERKMGLGNKEMTRRLFYASDGMMGTVVKTVRKAAHFAQKAKQDGLSPELLSRGYKDQVTDRKPIDPFLTDFDAVVKAAEQDARERIARRKRERKNGSASDPITTDDVFKPK